MNCNWSSLLQSRGRYTALFRFRSMSSNDALQGSEGLLNRVTSLKNWWNGATSSESPSEGPIPLLDLRSPSEFEKSRLFCKSPEMIVVPFPVENLRGQSFELPARHVKFSILVDPTKLEETQNFLLGPKPNARTRPRNPWKVTDVLLDNEELWQEAKDLGISQCTPFSQTDPIFPKPRLWQPDPMVQNVLLPLLQKSWSSPDLQVWDMASGAGRDVAFLAEELHALGTPHRVVGLDHRYNAKETGIVEGFWQRRGVGNYTQSVKMDLSKWDVLEQRLPASDLAALFAVRFWKPQLISDLSQSTVVKPGTLFGLSHFCKPHEGASWDFEHPSEKTVLERNQLSEMFQDGWDILYDEIALDSDHGRTMIQFVARKK